MTDKYDEMARATVKKWLATEDTTTPDLVRRIANFGRQVEQETVERLTQEKALR